MTTDNMPMIDDDEVPELNGRRATGKVDVISTPSASGYQSIPASSTNWWSKALKALGAAGAIGGGTYAAYVYLSPLAALIIGVCSILIGGAASYYAGRSPTPGPFTVEKVDDDLDIASVVKDIVPTQHDHSIKIVSGQSSTLAHGMGGEDLPPTPIGDAVPARSDSGRGRSESVDRDDDWEPSSYTPQQPSSPRVKSDPALEYDPDEAIAKIKAGAQQASSLTPAVAHPSSNMAAHGDGKAGPTTAT
jgi:hypothetical protein